MTDFESRCIALARQFELMSADERQSVVVCALLFYVDALLCRANTEDQLAPTSVLALRENIPIIIANFTALAED